MISLLILYFTYLIDLLIFIWFHELYFALTFLRLISFFLSHFVIWQTDTVQISVSSQILEVILDFLYTDDSHLLRESTDLTFICDVLSTAHLFMLSNLQHLCQRMMLKCLNLKNAFDIIQFSLLFDALKLKEVVLEFIYLNINYYFDTR